VPAQPLLFSITINEGASNMNNPNYLLEAIDAVLAQDISDEAFAEAVQSQVYVMSRINSDEVIAFQD